MNNKKIEITLVLLLLAIIGISGFFFYDLTEKSNELVKVNGALNSEINSIKIDQAKNQENLKESDKVKGGFIGNSITTLNEAQLLLEELYNKGWVNLDAGKVIALEIDFIEIKVGSMIKEVNQSNDLALVKSSEEVLVVFNDFIKSAKSKIVVAQSHKGFSEFPGFSDKAMIYYELMVEPLVKIKSFNRETQLLKCEGSYQERVDAVNNLKESVKNTENLIKEIGDTGWLSQKEKNAIFIEFNKKRKDATEVNYMEDLLLTNKTDYSLVYPCHVNKGFKNSSEKALSRANGLLLDFKEIILKIKQSTLKYCEKKSIEKCNEVNSAVLMSYSSEYFKSLANDTKNTQINLESIVNQVIEKKEKIELNSSTKSLGAESKTDQLKKYQGTSSQGGK